MVDRKWRHRNWITWNNKRKSDVHFIVVVNERALLRWCAFLWLVGRRVFLCKQNDANELHVEDNWLIHTTRCLCYIFSYTGSNMIFWLNIIYYTESLITFFTNKQKYVFCKGSNSFCQSKFSFVLIGNCACFAACYFLDPNLFGILMLLFFTLPGRHMLPITLAHYLFYFKVSCFC